MADKKYLIDSAELMAEWYWDKNKDLNPHTLTIGSHKKAYWLCGNGHEWQAQIISRTNGKGCPYCYDEDVIIGKKDRNHKKHNGYYDGHYHESKMSLEEIEKILEEEKKKVEQMTEWEDI